MSSILKRYQRILQSKKAGLLVFAALSVFTAIALVAPQFNMWTATPSLASPLVLGTVGPMPAPGGEPQIHVTLSQQKLVQGNSGMVYAEVVMQAPADGAASGERKPVDLVLVLDRSGSMAAENKLPLAKKAIAQLISRLGPEDRFALISFDNVARVHAELQPVTAENRASIENVLSGLNPGGATNISDGLERARAMLAGSNRPGRVLLLSDGEANNGVTDPFALGRIAASFSASSSSVLSTIGLGLGFNETLLAALADNGMGRYAYLEALDGLDAILVHELNDSRNIYARQSELEIIPAEGVRLLDAGGYPIQGGSGGSFRIPSGQLLAGSRKSFFLSLRVPVSRAGAQAVATMHVNYDRGEGTRMLEIPAIMVQVVPESLRDEAVASINNDVFKKNWMNNQVGMLQRNLAQMLRDGDRSSAEKAISEFERQADIASAEAPSVKEDIMKDISVKSGEMKRMIHEAFTGSPADQAVKQNRSAKSTLSGAYMLQRK